MLLRWVYFLGMILIGAVLGVLLGWYVFAAQSVDTAPDTLRIDYVTDYVLMTAEAFSKDGNLDLAIQRLNFLSAEVPGERIP